MIPCVDCETPIPKDVWEEELGMCLDCSDAYWTHNEEGTCHDLCGPA